MSVRDLRMPAIVAWIFFVPGVLFVTVDIVRLSMTGLAVLGAVFLVLWMWLLGVFRREFWIADRETSERLSAIDAELDEAEGRR